MANEDTAPEVTLSGDALVGCGPHVAALAQLPQTVRLGRIAPKSRPMAPALSAFLDETVAATNPPPPSTNRRATAAASLARMYLNDRYGCCVIAGKAHALGLYSGADKNPGGVVLATDQEIYSQYQGICGPGDRGCVITDVLDVMRSKGFQASGKLYRIDGYVSGDWRQKLIWQVGLFIFGAATIGFSLPDEWTRTAVWKPTNSRIIGGHDVTPVDYDEQGVYVSSWGRIYLMTWEAALSTRWISELYFLLAPLWYGDDRVAPSGIDVVALQAALEAIGGGHLPPIPDPQPKPPVPPTPAPLPAYLTAFDAQGKPLGRYDLKQ